jgi:hypothetical protein
MPARQPSPQALAERLVPTTANVLVLRGVAGRPK